LILSLVFDSVPSHFALVGMLGGHVGGDRDVSPTKRTFSSRQCCVPKQLVLLFRKLQWVY
jgi:hypothetical protein